ncbi:hypothetical protein PRK78_005359 [Emydomyces testavorans]|uniref:Copper acquisition factor BIM1-like domain-containing protein n=1 Tax=Emydomyces testavorans TaxID=2070801 RepID=A0AAF0IJY8_9EURO|nr:hypothetical protein PRK78_005359 [Emydomyces testavorans]
MAVASLATINSSSSSGNPVLAIGEKLKSFRIRPRNNQASVIQTSKSSRLTSSVANRSYLLLLSHELSSLLPIPAPAGVSAFPRRLSVLARKLLEDPIHEALSVSSYPPCLKYQHVLTSPTGGGVNVTTNRTEWPVDGGSLVFAPGHPWAFTYVNLGIGSDDNIIFNVTLVPVFNQTGNGTFCFPKIPIPKGTPISAGTNASVQVIQIGETGSSLYNCADITFSDKAQLLSEDRCKNSTGIGWKPIGASATTNGSSSTTSTSATATKSNAAPEISVTWNVGLAGLLFGLVGNLL